MSYGSNLGDSSGGSAMSEINVTPLVDVLLVLLIIFMITAPMLTHKISIDLPQPNHNVTPPDNPPEPLHLSIHVDGSLYLNDVPVSESNLKLQLEVYASKPKDKQPEVQIQAADDTEYQVVAQVLSDAKSVGMEKIGFVNTDSLF